MPPISDPEKLERLRQHLSLLNSELSQLQNEQESFNTNSAIGYFGTGIAQMTEGASDIFLNVSGFLYGGVHKKIQEYADLTKNVVVKLSEGDYSGIAIDHGIRRLEGILPKESLVLKTLNNVADPDKSNAEKFIDAAGDLGSYLEDESLETAASIVSGANTMHDGVNTLQEGLRYREQMNSAFEKRRTEIQEKMKQLQKQIRETERLPYSTPIDAPQFAPILARINDGVNQLIANIPG